MKVSVIITAYNDVATLAEAIESVIDQTAKADEIIVVDDGSSDATSEVAKVYDEVSLLRQKHMGSFSARNNGAMMAENRWITFLDATQKWDQDKLKKPLVIQISITHIYNKYLLFPSIISKI